ncbi:MAG: DUF3761 domain-containing protein [Actinomycetota bacterium]
MAICLAAVLAAAAAAVSHPAHAALQCRAGYYKNVSGVCVHRPDSNAIGATAQCRDGSYSHSQHASGTCSGHGGVRIRIHHP